MFEWKVENVSELHYYINSNSIIWYICEFHILETLLSSLNGDVYVIGAEEYTQAIEKTEETYHHNNDVEWRHSI